MRAPDWTVGEFDVLVGSYGISNDELANRLPQRSSGAIDVVREGVHSYHRGGNISMLSLIMRDYLDSRRGSLICPKCGLRF